MRRGLSAILLGLTLVGCSGGVGSIGAVLGKDNRTGALTIRDVPKGLAADKAGLEPGDQVVMIEGVYVADLSPKEIHDKLRGDVGSTVELTVDHRGEVRRVKLVRSALKEHAAKPAEKAGDKKPNE